MSSPAADASPALSPLSAAGQLRPDHRNRSPMMPTSSIDYQQMLVNGIALAYTDRGEGQPILFIHGFAASSYTWLKMIDCLPRQFRFITIDLKGFGHSEKRCDDRLSPFDQAQLVAEFIRLLDLHNLVLVGHSMGGAISLLTLFDEQMKARIVRLVLIDSAGIFNKLPDFIDDLTAAAPDHRILKMADEELLVAIVMKQAFFDHRKITDEAIREYSGVLRQAQAKECLCASARQIAIANAKSFHEQVRAIRIPALIIWGGEDGVIDLLDAFKLKVDLKHAVLRIIDGCGHSPQEEAPVETAEALAEFLGVALACAPPFPGSPENAAKDAPGHQAGHDSPQLTKPPSPLPRKMRMRRLVDRWSLGTFLIIFMIKLLQLLKLVGFKAKMNGWRKVTGIFLRREYSKFILASFRINYLGQVPPPADPDAAKKILVERLAEFIRQHPDCRWTITWSFFLTRSKRTSFADLVEAEFNDAGDLLQLIPHFDRNHPVSPLFDHELGGRVLARTIEAYNTTKTAAEQKRAWIIYQQLMRWVSQLKGRPFRERLKLIAVINRLMNASFIQFQTLAPDPPTLTSRRMATPDLSKRSHPGFGLLNLVCRFTADYAEADLWCQYHHVPVDGVPMQEILQKLKQEWGEVGPVKYPKHTAAEMALELAPCGNQIYRAKAYFSFDQLLQFRKYLNRRYYAEMGGPATIASMVIWGLARQPYFQNRKFLFPVDAPPRTNDPQARNISFIFILPKPFFNPEDPLAGFLKYQREFNHRVFATRLSKSESYELFELYALMHPMFYHLVKYLMPKTLGELVGTVGLTIIKDAEMFICPVSELHAHGFLAIGNLAMPTEDGGTAGAVSICGTPAQIDEYAKALQQLVENFPALVSRPDDQAQKRAH